MALCLQLGWLADLCLYLSKGSIKVDSIGTVPIDWEKTGTLKPGMVLIFASVNVTTKIKSAEMYCDIMSKVLPENIVALHASRVSVKDVHHGNIAADSKNDPSMGAAGFSAQVITLNHWDQICAGPVPVLDCHSTQIACKCAELKEKMDYCPSQKLEEGPKF